MFEKGCYVIYRAEGVCMITDVRQESFGSVGDKKEYYILSPMREPRSTVFVPVDNEILVGYMRELMNAEQIMKMVEEQRQTRIEWTNDSRARNSAWKEILARGDRRELVTLINTLSEKIEASGKKPCSTDLNALRRAEKLLYDEFSATTDIQSVDDVIPLLNGTLTVRDRAIDAAV